MDLYFMLRSPPCRSVLMTGRAVGVEFNLIPTNLRDGDHLTEKFLKVILHDCKEILIINII